MLPSMERSIQILAVILLLTFASVAKAQTATACGIAGIDGPSQVEPGTPLVFKVKLTGMIHTTKPEFKWTLSAGTITTGQGTDEITIDSAGLGGLNLTITAELTGAPPACTASLSKTTQVNLPPIMCIRPFDEYGDIKFADEKARLDNFAIQLQNDPLASGSILVAAGKETFENEAAERLNRAKSYLVDVRGIDPNRIVTVDCGFAHGLTTRLYMVPHGASFPPCNDDVSVPVYEIKFTKRRPKSSPPRKK